MAIYDNISSLKIGDNTYNLKNTTYGTVTSSADGLMSSADKSKLDNITNNANRIESTSTDGSINLIKWTKSTPSTLLSFVSGSSFTLSSTDLAIGDGENFPVILDSQNKPFVTVPTYKPGTKGDLTSSTSGSTENKVWSAHVLNEWIGDIIGVDLEAITNTITGIEELLENNNKADGIISELKKKWTKSDSSIGDTNQPIYWNGSNFVKATYTLNATVPSTAEFTDTTYSAYTGLGLLSSNHSFYLKSASNDTIGGIKVSNVLSSTVDLTIANGNTPYRYYGVQIDSDGTAFVNVPWSNDNTTYGKASTDTLGLIKVFGTTTATITSGNNKNYGVKLDSDGKAYVNVPWEKSSIATSSTAGIIKPVKSYTSSGGIAPSSDMINEITSTGNATNISGRYYGVQTLEDGTAFVNVPWTNPTYNVVSGGAPIDKAPGFGGTFSVPYISQSTSGQLSITDKTITMPSTPTLKASISTSDNSVLILSI